MTHLGTFRGFNYRSPEPTVSLVQSTASAIALAVFAVAVVLWCAS